MLEKDDPNQKKYLGEASEQKVLRIIRSLHASRTPATQAELISRTGLDVYVVRQVLRRLRRKKKVTITFLPGVGKRKIRVYS